ncbi:MAG: gamma-glutamyltransferase family protein [Paracoccaceae bacterium]
MRDFHLPGRSTVFASNGMCATSHPLAAEVALSLLKSGGNAMDAAIAGALILNIAEPSMCGLGGDCFALFSPAGEDRVIGLNGSGRAPAGLDAESLRAAGSRRLSPEGIESVTLPGAVDAFCRLSEDWGRLGLPTLLAPAIAYARQGVPVAPRVAFDWADDAPRLKGAARRFYLPDGKVPVTGTLFRAPEQAEVLERIAREGRAGFYDGPVGADLVDSLRALGGTHTAEDLQATSSFYTQPIAGNWGGFEVLEHPPNGQGATALLLLNMLAGFDLASLDPFGSARAHLEAELAKLAYMERNRLIADPASAKGAETMLDMQTARRLAASFDPTRATASLPRPAEAMHRDTVYITVVDRDLMAVSLIYSIFDGFGSGFASDRYGILFQNRGAGFSLVKDHPNEAAGGKRPMHTIIPGMVRQNGRVIMPFGVMGGHYQPTGHARLLTNILTYGMDLQEAMDAPRSFGGPEGLELERGYAPAVRAELAALGHQITTPYTPLGGSQAIWIDHARGVLIGGSDPRKDGIALGY